MWVNLLKKMGKKTSCKRHYPLSNLNTTQNNTCSYVVKCQHIHGRAHVRVVTFLEEKEE